MTLTTPYSATFIVGDGETKTFSYLFEEVSSNFISVMVYNSLTGLISTPTYIIDTDQKQVIFGEDTPAPTADETVCIYRNTPNVQDVAFRTLHGYDAQTLENILSKIVAMIQEIKSNYFSTQVLQGDPWQLDLLSSADDGATVNIDYTAKKLVKGLYFKITSGNLQVSADGANYMTLPKSDDVAEFRQYEQTLPDLTVIRKLQYRVGNQWYDAEANTEAIANKAVEIAEEARDIAEEARDIANDAKNTADNIDGKAQQALDNSIEAVETAEEAKNMIQNQIIVRSATIPTASASLVGKAYQYAGTTNGQYTHNYIYECVAGETTYTGIIGFDPAKIAFDYTKGNLAEFFNDTTPNFSQITHGTFTYDIAGDIWTIVGKDSNENVLFSNYKLYTEDLQDAGFVFINPPQDYADGEVIDFEVTFTPQPTTYAWVRVDVQPDRITQIQALQADITDIQALIPAQASSANQLGDKNFINSSIATNTANFIGTFNSVADLESYSGTVTNNDYAFVIGTDSAGNTTYNRYKYTTATTPASWIYEYTLNNSSFTAVQWATINSGATATDVAKARSAVQPGDLATVATTGSYNDLSNKPTIPTVNDATITFTQGGVTKGSITLNQSSASTIAFDSGGASGHEVIEFQAPTSSNNYTWYRKYADGWVEQGGISNTNSGTSGTIALPITMQDNNYTAIAGNGNNAANNYFTISRQEATTTTIKWYKSSSSMNGYWEVKGMASGANPVTTRAVHFYSRIAGEIYLTEDSSGGDMGITLSVGTPLAVGSTFNGNPTAAETTTVTVNSISGSDVTFGGRITIAGTVYQLQPLTISGLLS